MALDTLSMQDLWAQQRFHPRRHAAHIVERPIGVWLQRSRENTRHAVIAKRAVKAFEFRRAAGKIDDIDRLSGARAFRHHIHRIARHHDEIGKPEKPKIGILAATVPEVMRNRSKFSS